MSRLVAVGQAIVAHVAPHVDVAELSYAPQTKLGELDGVTKAIVMPTGTDREIGRGCTHFTYHFEVGILRWLKNDEDVGTYVALAEDIADDLMGDDLGIGVCVQDVQTTICDADAVQRRKQFVSVLTLDVLDGQVEVWA